jgi:hypothetical protein
VGGAPGRSADADCHPAAADRYPHARPTIDRDTHTGSVADPDGGDSADRDADLWATGEPNAAPAAGRRSRTLANPRTFGHALAITNSDRRPAGDQDG